MTTKVYLAGASKEAGLCQSFMDRLHVAGIRITHNWCEPVRANAGRPDGAIQKPERRRYAEDDLEGVEACNIFWLVTPDAPTIGAWVELGYALCLRYTGIVSNVPRIIVSGPWRTIFGDLADTFETHEDAIAHLISHYGELPA